MKCNHCGFEIPDGNNFCGNCGTKAGSGSTTPADFPKMPASLTDKINRQKDKLPGSRRNVAVVFADLSGFTKLSSGSDPEQVADRMNQLFTRLSEAIYKYEGYIDKYIGDCVMVLFGAPISHENDPLRSVLCALEMQETMSEFEDLELSIGINFGEVVAGGIGSDNRMEYTVIGDVVNIAQRLQASAGPGKINVSEAVFKQTESEVEYIGPEYLRVKGRENRLRVFVPVKAHTRSSIRPISERPLIGRDKEMELLNRAYSDMLNGRGRIIEIIGEAGIGKSKLVFEFISELDQNEFLALTGRCIDYLRDVEYFPIKEIFRELMGLDDGFSAKDVSIGIEKFISDTDSGLFYEHIPLLKYLFSAEMTDAEKKNVESIKPENRNFILNRYIIRLLEKLSQKTPIILVIDDIHWSDSETLKFIKQISQQSKTRRLMVILLFRPEFKDNSIIEELIQIGKPGPINLNYLNKPRCRRLVTEILECENADDKLIQLIMERTDGNPFYIEELTSHLLNSDLIELRSGIAFITGGGWDRVPIKLNELISAKIDKLAPELKRVIQLASVIGKEFTEQILKQLVEPPGNLTSDLKLLKKADIIRSTQPGHQYSFKHIITRDVVYNSILKSDRKDYHESVGFAIEQIYKDNPEDYLELLIHHFKLSNNQEKFLKYLSRFAVKEKDMGNYVKSETLFEDWYQSSGSDSFRDEAGIKNLIQFAGTKVAVSKYEEGLKLLDEIELKGSDMLKGESLIEFNLGKWVCLVSTGKLDDALKYNEQNLVLAKKFELTDGPLLAKCFSSLGSTFYFKQNHDEALENYNKAIKVLKNSVGEMYPDLADVYNNIGGVFFMKHDFDKALEYLDKSSEIIRNNFGEHHPNLASIYNNIGAAYMYKGDFERVVQFYRKAIDIYKSSFGEYHSNVAVSYKNLATFLLQSGDLVGAEEYYNKSMEINLKIFGNFHAGTAIDYNGLGMVSAAREDNIRAIEYYKQALKIFEQVLDSKDLNVSLPIYGLAEIYYKSGKFKEALEHINRVVEIRRKAGNNNLPKLAEAEFLAGKINKQLGNSQQANTHLDLAIEIARQFNLPWLTEAKSIRAGR